jgi:hypothetical protein
MNAKLIAPINQEASERENQGLPMNSLQKQKPEPQPKLYQ